MSEQIEVKMTAAVTAKLGEDLCWAFLARTLERWRTEFGGRGQCVSGYVGKSVIVITDGRKAIVALAEETPPEVMRALTA